MITSILIGLSILAFGLAYYFRDKHFSTQLYDSITCFGSALIIGVVLFDFLPHQYSDFVSTSDVHEHHHGHHHHHSASVDWLKLLWFGAIVIAGVLFQLGIEKAFHVKLSTKFENGMLVLGMFLHSLSEVSVLYDAGANLDKALFTAIIFHKVPLAFILAYSLLSRSSVKMSMFWFAIFMSSIPIGLVCNQYASGFPVAFNVIAVFVSGMMLHVVWHILDAVKDRNTLNYSLFFGGVICGYLITLFHSH